MAQKSLAVLVILLFLGAGFFIGSLAGGFVGQLTVPASHKAIVEKIEVKDTKAIFALTPIFVISKTATWGKGIPLSIFDYSSDYTQSTWLWQRYDDVEFVMTIWGPGNDGKTYLIEFGKVSNDPFTISFDGATFIMAHENKDSMQSFEGSYWFTVQVS